MSQVVSLHSSQIAKDRLWYFNHSAFVWEGNLYRISIRTCWSSVTKKTVDLVMAFPEDAEAGLPDLNLATFDEAQLQEVVEGVLLALQ